MADDTQDLLRLADEVAAATGPDRDLAMRVATATGWCFHPSGRQRDDSAQSDRGHTCLDCGADSWGNTGPTGQKRSASMPDYLASLDAAETLVPAHAVGWRMDWSGRRAIVRIGFGGFPETIEAWAATPALALCAAALKARAHSTKDTSNVG